MLTGGGSQLTGIRELASKIMDKQVRLGKPNYIKGLAESVSGPAFSVPAGLIQFVLKERKRGSLMSPLNVEATSSRLTKIGKWLRENI